MINVLRELAENRISNAKQAAVAVCKLDDSKKNAAEMRRLINIFENRSENFIEVPLRLKGLLEVTNLNAGSYKPNRYFLDKSREELISQIENSVKVSGRLAELGIPYLNSTLLSGEPGTGKTEFAKAAAYRLGIPFAYVNFSNLIDSYLGKTSQNISQIFDYIKGERCLLLLDEIDCIGLRRNKDGGADGELARTTIALMQCLDTLIDGQIIIGATNRADRLDPALLRRFQRRAVFEKYNEEDNRELIIGYLNDVGLDYDKNSVLEYVSGTAGEVTQAVIVQHLNDAIVSAVISGDAVKI